MEVVLFLLVIFLLLKNDESLYRGRVYTNPDIDDDELPPTNY